MQIASENLPYCDLIQRVILGEDLYEIEAYYHPVVGSDGELTGDRSLCLKMYKYE